LRSDSGQSEHVLQLNAVNERSVYEQTTKIENLIGRDPKESLIRMKTGKTRKVHTELSCEDGPRPIKIPSAVQCDCFDCAVH
ncbi:hypothetical protein ANCDUO_12736, partial [Ancylostoma duodenale]